jgi:hypothetical protein
MSDVNAGARPDPPIGGSEAETLLGFLEFQRATPARKCSGLGAAGLRSTVGVSTMTLGGLLAHLAQVEDSWFTGRFAGRPPADTGDRLGRRGGPSWPGRRGAAPGQTSAFRVFRRCSSDSP